MTKELAKLLKEAGFPQDKKIRGDFYVPTLDDLVAECAGQFWSLRRTPAGKWIATGRLTRKEDKIPYYETVPYDHPDEAVAELFVSIKAHEREQAAAEEEA